LVVEEVVRTLPTLYDDVVSAYASVATTIDVLVNDITPNDAALNIVAVTSALNGLVEIVDNTLIYTSNDDFTGNDRIDYIACDAEGNCETARVSISVIPEVVEVTLEEAEQEFGESVEEVPIEEVEETVEVFEEVEELEEEVLPEFVEVFEITKAYQNGELIQVEFTNPVEEFMQYRLIDMAGKVRADGKIETINGTNQLEIRRNNIETGMFMIYITNTHQSNYRKIFIE